MNVPLARPDHPDNASAILETLREIIFSGRWSQGEFAKSFERSVAEYCGSVYAVATNSGTSALELILAACGIQPNTEVLCPSYTFVATANAVLSTGATPVFVDIEPGGYNIDLRDAETKITPKTKAMILVHQFGIPANGSDFSEFCRKHDIVLIEDAACGLGSFYDGKPVGTFGIAGLVSFHPRKVVSTGEGGMVLTDDDRLADKVRSIGNHGRDRSQKGLTTIVGHNYRMSEFQAALGLWAMEHLSEAISRRKLAAEHYYKALKDIRGISAVKAPLKADWNFQSFPVRVPPNRRDLLVMSCEKMGIELSPGPLPVHQHTYIEHLLHPARLPNTEAAYEETLLLPMFAAIQTEQQNIVLDALTEHIS